MATAPATGSLKMAVWTVIPFQTTFRGSPTLTETIFMRAFRCLQMRLPAASTPYVMIAPTRSGAEAIGHVAFFTSSSHLHHRVCVRENRGWRLRFLECAFQVQNGRCCRTALPHWDCHA